MNKKLVRVLALILCAVMILGMIPMIANAEEIQSRTITEEYGTYYFETFEELKELAATTTCDDADFCYQGEGELVITEDLTLPEEYWLEAECILVVENVTLNATYIKCQEFVVAGTVSCDTVVATALLDVSGTLNAESSVQLSGTTTQLIGVENIYPEDTDIMCYGTVETMEQLKEVVAGASAMTDERVWYIHELTLPEITESITIPANCQFEIKSPVTIAEGATLTVEAKLQVSERLTVRGGLNAPSVEVFCYAGGVMEIAEGASTDIDKVTLNKEWTEVEVEDAVPGLDLSLYEITDWYYCWTLVKIENEDDAPSQEEVVAGDADGNNIVDDADVAQLLWYTLFPENYEISCNADFNGDEVVDDADVAYLLWHTLFPDAYPLN
ncbi:MAG: hypothetical protein J6B95_00805 [Oscillospiraceae bacterium]|nr:hypothetical protein [Oscillospiraceae bacterium]